MVAKPSEVTGEDIPQPRILTEEESLAMRESLAGEFTKVWKDDEFDDNRECHGKVIALAMLLQEYWEE